MRVLLLGSGGREHAIAWKISQSSILDELFIAPGNAGTKKHGKNLDLKLNDFEAIKQAVLQYAIDMVVVGPEEPPTVTSAPEILTWVPSILIGP